MAQRCSYCGKTEKQHGGKACIDADLLRVIEIRKALEKAKAVKMPADLSANGQDSVERVDSKGTK